MRALGVEIEEMRTYQANRSRGHEAAAEQRDLRLRHARRIEADIAAQYTGWTTCARKQRCGMPVHVATPPRKLRPSNG
jgi:hypothetical protein